MKKMLTVLLAVWALSFVPVSANDSAAAIGLGGLELQLNDDISMDSEELFISHEEIRVKYHFTNNSSRDITTLISFPLPPLPPKGQYGDMNFSDWTELAFETKVDGKPVKLKRVDKAIDGDGKDVTALVEKQGWPLFYWNSAGIAELLKKTPIDVKERFLKAGLLSKESYEVGAYYPTWSVQSHITRTQTFPAGKTVMVEHRYKPVAGGSVGGGLERQYRSDYSDHLKAFCVDKYFLAGFDKRRYSGKKDKDGNETGMFYVEHWVDYILSSGANWKGPIKDFRLVVDKGKPTNLVSFCMDGVAKISPTRFEVRKKNFEPKRDLKILIVEWFEID